MMMKPSVVLFT